MLRMQKSRASACSERGAWLVGGRDVCDFDELATTRISLRYGLKLAQKELITHLERAIVPPSQVMTLTACSDRVKEDGPALEIVSQRRSS